jgi:hypothetical protein
MVCVCAIHQNIIILMVQGAYPTADVNANNLHEKIVCSTGSETYASCPGANAVCNVLSEIDNFEFGYRQ